MSSRGQYRAGLGERGEEANFTVAGLMPVGTPAGAIRGLFQWRDAFRAGLMRQSISGQVSPLRTCTHSLRT
jgi:hypothetical protein